MEIFGVIVVGVLAILLIAGASYILIWIVKESLGEAKEIATKSLSSESTSTSSGMNEGDFHSGPEGYSPNTGYPDTFYGSGGHDEGDFNR